ncbi:hypothetical protein BGX30_003139 [Mortierella sp. GBA39]|nr:hypothetical protein BGX30_003139 [Mortierella sp. GBA39]
MAPGSSTRFFEMSELVIHLIQYLDPAAISRLMQASRHLKNIFTPKLYYRVRATFDHAVAAGEKHNIFSSPESIQALGKNVDHVRQLDLKLLEITYYVNCVFAHWQEQEQEEEKKKEKEEEDVISTTTPPSPPPSADNTTTTTTTTTATKWDQERRRRPLWLAPPDPHTCTVHPMRPMTQLTKLKINATRSRFHGACPYRLPSFSDPKAAVTFICWIMDCNPFLQDVDLMGVLIRDQRDIRLLTTALFGLKKLRRLRLYLEHWDTATTVCRWVQTFFGCCPSSVEVFEFRLCEMDFDCTWGSKFTRLQRKEVVPVWQKSDQDCGLLPIAMGPLYPLRQEPLKNLTRMILADLNDEIVLEEELRSVLEQCPNLTSITMPTVAPIRNPKRLAQDIALCCPKLESVDHANSLQSVEIWETLLWLLDAMPEQQMLEFSCYGGV